MFYGSVLGYAAFSLLVSFAAGKGSALVIDVGQTMASVTPVVDGFVLRKGEHAFSLAYNKINKILVGLMYSALPKLVHAHARHILVTPTQQRRGIDLLSHQLLTNKVVSGARPLDPDSC